MSDQPKPIGFDGVLESARGGGAVVEIPRDAAQALGGVRQTRVTGRVNGVDFRSSTMPAGDGRLFLGLHMATREAARVVFGDRLHVELALDTSPRTLDLPPELAAAFDAEPPLRERFDALSFTRRKELASSVAEAKRPETRSRRLDAALSELRSS